MKPLNGAAKFWAAVASVCVSILVAGFWVITAVGAISEDMAVLTERVNGLTTVIESNGMANQRWIDSEFDAIKTRVAALEKE